MRIGSVYGDNRAREQAGPRGPSGLAAGLPWRVRVSKGGRLVSVCGRAAKLHKDQALTQLEVQVLGFWWLVLDFLEVKSDYFRFAVLLKRPRKHEARPPPPTARRLAPRRELLRAKVQASRPPAWETHVCLRRGRAPRRGVDSGSKRLLHVSRVEGVHFRASRLPPPAGHDGVRRFEQGAMDDGRVGQRRPPAPASPAALNEVLGINL